MGLLDDILRAKRDEAVALARSPESPRPAAWAVRDAALALARPEGAPLRLIAEHKRRSPSAGALSTSLGPAARARAYVEAGASMISVLTDARWFDGGFDQLAEIRAAVPVPLLCKDFVVDAAQIEAAWCAGADAVLLIARCLPGDQLARLVTATRARGLAPFVEVADEAELARALDAGATLVGVNARDLDTLTMDASRAARVVAAVPTGCVAVHLSGVRDAADAARVARSRADAALVGEALMRDDDPRARLRSMVEAAKLSVEGAGD